MEWKGYLNTYMSSVAQGGSGLCKAAPAAIAAKKEIVIGIMAVACME